MNIRRITRFGLLTAVALVLGYIERFLPVVPGIPGIKPGLANTVLLYAVYLMSARAAALLMLCKVLLSGFLFAGPSAMAYSLAGGALSLAAMLPLHRVKGMGIIGVSVGGAVAHNIGQTAVACLVIRAAAALSCLPALMVSGIVTGAVTGTAAKYIMAALGKAGLNR